MQSFREEGPEQERPKREGLSQDDVQANNGTARAPEQDRSTADVGPAQPPKERVSAGSLSAAKERYLSRKKQRTQELS